MCSSLVSVIVPFFNRVALVCETISSVVNQSYCNFELLLIDDGSDADSVCIIQQMIQADARIKLIRREFEPKGAPSCRNIGIEHAIGKYIIFLDSDDILAPWCLEDRVFIFDQQVDLDFIVFQASFFSFNLLDSKAVWNILETNRADVIRFIDNDVPWSILQPIWNADFLKESFIRFDTDALSYQDWEFHIRILIKTKKYIKVNKIDSFIREHRSGRISSNSFNIDHIISRLSTFEKIVELLKESSFFTSEFNFYFAVRFIQEAEKIITLKGQFSLWRVLSPVYKYSFIHIVLLVYIYFYLLIAKLIVRINRKLFFGLKRRIFKFLFPKFVFRSATGCWCSEMTDVEISYLRERLSKY